jgi:hypothetical protein
MVCNEICADKIWKHVYPWKHRREGNKVREIVVETSVGQGTGID